MPSSTLPTSNSSTSIPWPRGTQVIELQGTDPKLKAQMVDFTRRRFFRASGEFFDDGGIEMTYLDALASLGPRA